MSVDDQELHRSFLYAPGSDAEVMGKALASSADAVILDLEDAVAPAAKGRARELVAEAIHTVDTEAGARHPAVHVRINRAGDGYSPKDLDAVVVAGLGGIRLPKVEAGEHVAAVGTLLDELERARGIAPGTIRLYPTVESAVGVTRLAEIVAASRRVRRVALGTTDLLADLGAVGDEDLATLAIRTGMVVTSRAAGIGPPVDSVHTRLDDADGLRARARRARSLGFWGKSVIHPRQLTVVHDVFTFDEQQVTWARRILDALAQAGDAGQGAVQVDGEFVDEAVAARARSILHRKGARR